MKPIEPGCRAVIVNSLAGNQGLVVTVIKHIAQSDCGVGFHHGEQGERWEIDIMIASSLGLRINHVGENQLQRIDDYDGNDVISWDDKRCVWQPEKITA